MNVSILMQTALNVIEAGMLFIQITVTVNRYIFVILYNRIDQFDEISDSNNRPINIT